MHLLIKLFDCFADDENVLYREVSAFSWDKIISTNQTFIIRVKGKSKYFTNNNCRNIIYFLSLGRPPENYLIN